MKARFLTSLKVAREDGGAWTLTKPLIYDSEILGKRITVPPGFQTDFASVPRLPLIYLLYGGDVADEAAVVHDFLYSGGAGQVSRATCDAVFREAMQAQGVGWFRRFSMWFGVRIFGGSRYARP